jgi:hypothetical protein
MDLDYTIEVEHGWDKLVELVTYIARRFEDQPRFGLTKLAKILFRVDFQAYVELNAPVTGISYRKFPWGPLPDDMYSVIEEQAHLKLEESGPPEFRQRRVLSSREAELGVFSAGEKQLIDRVIDEVWELSAEEVSALSHGIAWQLVAEKAHIPYQAAFLGEPGELSEAERAFALDLLKDG